MRSSGRFLRSTLIGLAVFVILPIVAPVAFAATSGQATAAPAHLPFLFAAYAVAWLFFFGYTYWASRKQFDLERQVHELRKQLSGGSK